MENTFKNIDLEKLSYDELQLLLEMVDLYVSEYNFEVISEFKKAELQDYENKICEAMSMASNIEKEADEIEKEFNKAIEDNAKMYALNDIERDERG